MNVELSDFEAKVVRSALMEFALMIQPAAQSTSPEGRRFPIEQSSFLVMESANDISERLEGLLSTAKGPQPVRNTFREPQPVKYDV